MRTCSSRAMRSQVISEWNRGDNHVVLPIKCGDIGCRPSLPGPSVRIGCGRAGRVEGRSARPASCPGPLLSLCVFGSALRPREMRGSVCSAEHVFWSARGRGTRERVLRGTAPSHTTPWGSRCGVETPPFRLCPVLPGRLSFSCQSLSEQPMPHHLCKTLALRILALKLWF